MEPVNSNEIIPLQDKTKARTERQLIAWGKGDPNLGGTEQWLPCTRPTYQQWPPSDLYKNVLDRVAELK